MAQHTVAVDEVRIYLSGKDLLSTCGTCCNGLIYSNRAVANKAVTFSLTEQSCLL